MPDNPERDRYIANKPRLRPRRGLDVADLAQQFVRSSEVKALRRHAHVKTALTAALPPALLGRVSIGSVRSGVLSLQVADGVALAELKQHYDRVLRDALVEAGAGVSRITYRLARTSHGRRSS